MRRTIMAVATLRSGQVTCVATDRSHNFVHALDGERWQEVVRWPGREVTAACACGDAIVCAALDGQAYVVQGTTVSPLPLPERSDWLYAAAAVSDDVALFGGTGGLFVVSVAQRTVTRRRLSEFNVSRPGRDVHGIVNTGARTLLLGKKNLLVEYRGDSAVELVSRAALAGREYLFKDAAELDGVLWLCGISPKPFLARHVGESVQTEAIPLVDPHLPSLAVLGNELILAANRIFAGRPGRWRELLPGPARDDGIVGITPRAGAAAQLCAVSAGGASFLIDDGQSCQEIRVF